MSVSISYLLLRIRGQFCESVVHDELNFLFGDLLSFVIFAFKLASTCGPCVSCVRSEAGAHQTASDHEHDGLRANRCMDVDAGGRCPVVQHRQGTCIYRRTFRVRSSLGLRVRAQTAPDFPHEAPALIIVLRICLRFVLFRIFFLLLEAWSVLWRFLCFVHEDVHLPYDPTWTQNTSQHRLTVAREQIDACMWIQNQMAATLSSLFAVQHRH